ncbi:peptidase family M1-domain-containing protein [Hygrophoropsis aurantiaca]|uniref:Peptidase family M1-domain-containing protein n=1 Tax=Hygrophoropsis aurantiaca TaxID=72124 RepID=A0ACB8A9V7_9AGAM|nr:peptidase family M1-domain-containing protein [Hygrophoropsis aurantiaca]
MQDPTSQTNYLQIATKHFALEWKVDFEQSTISGTVVHDLVVKEDNVTEVSFDTFGLKIYDVEVSGKPVQFSLGSNHPVMGCALHIPIFDGAAVGSIISVKINYSTSKNATALQWLQKEQTQGKGFPFLFSQCQPIYARSLVPIQDTPSVKSTYTAAISAVLPVLMSAIRVSPSSEGPAHDGKVIGRDMVTYTYRQPVPIPSYLLAIASGNVVYRAFEKLEGKDWTSGVWAEPELIGDAHWEFREDTTRFLAAEEKLTTNYKWGVYDLLVLPPSFPYGGMENACLTFVTPTVIAGDRTLVDVVVHEITHSYFGNGVTHADASHFWLNEGWTNYMERLLQQELRSPAHRGFAMVIGAKELYDDLKLYEGKKSKYQRLQIDFEVGEDPDDAYSSVPYEKGCNFLLHLERTLGGLDIFLPYVKDYVNTFMGKSITTSEWKTHLYAYFKQHGGEEKLSALDSIDWNAWLFGEGLTLPVEMEYDLSLVKQAYALAERWDASRAISDLSKLDFRSDDLKDMDTNQIIAFLERLQSYHALPPTHIKHLASLYDVASTKNAEVRLRFYEVALLDPKASGALDYAQEAVNWVVGNDGTGIVKGRMKFCRPVFRDVNGVDAALARNTYLQYKESFHPIARNLIEKDIGLFSKP